MSVDRSLASNPSWMAFLLLAPLTVAGCSSSSPAPADDEAGAEGDVDPEAGGDNNDGNDNAGNDVGDVLFFEGSLKAVDPRDPTRIFEFSSEELETEAILSGDFSGTDGVINNIRSRGLAYVEGNELHFIDSAVRAGNVPSDTLLATLSANGEGIDVSPDFANANRSRIIVSFANGTSEVVSLAGNDAQPFPGSHITDLFDTSNGALLGWLTLDGLDIKHVSAANMAETVVKTITGSASSVDDLEITAGGTAFFEADGTIHAFDMSSTNPAIDSGFSPASESDCAVDRDSLFVISQAQDGFMTVERIDAGGNASTLLFESSPIFDEPDVDIAVAGDRLLLQFTSPNGQVLRSVDKNGLNSVELETATSIGFTAVSGDQVIFQRTTGLLPIVNDAVVVNVDGSAREVFSDSQWVGGTFGNLSLVGDVHTNFFLAQGVDDLGLVGGATLHTVSASNPRELGANLGTIPGDLAGIFFFGAGDAVLGFGSTFDLANPDDSQFDILLVEAGRAGSLTRVTNTPDVNEEPVEFL